jgi:pimeloyl-ACP methyl ester carboxylesterase
MSRNLVPGAEGGDGLRETRLSLADGRRLGVAEYGDPVGDPVLLFHGVPGSRLSFRFAHETARVRGVRLVAPERPGYGLSDDLSGRILVGWVDDTVQVADQLGLTRFSVIGYSGGAPYALACGWAAPERVKAVGVVSGMGPVDDPALRKQATRRQRLTLHLVRDVPGFPGLLSFAARLLLKHAPLSLLLRVASLIPEPGREVLRANDFRDGVLGGFREGFRRTGAGFARDLHLLARPWGFPLAEVRVPVRLWHGEDDFNVPVALARAVARALPRCRATFVRRAGHLWVLDHLPEVLGGVLDAARRPPGDPAEVGWRGDRSVDAERPVRNRPTD